MVLEVQGQGGYLVSFFLLVVSQGTTGNTEEDTACIFLCDFLYSHKKLIMGLHPDDLIHCNHFPKATPLNSITRLSFYSLRNCSIKIGLGIRRLSSGTNQIMLKPQQCDAFLSSPL